MRTARVLLLALIFGSSALAHDTVTAGAVKVEFHTDANEILKVNADTKVSFTLTVKGKKLAPRACKCQLLLYAGKPSARVKPNIIALEPDPVNPDALLGLVTVTQAGSYSLVLDGRPATAGAFDAFKLTYTLQAAESVFNVPPGGKP